MPKLGNKIVKWFYNNNETHCEIKSYNKSFATGVVTRFHKDKPNKRLARDIAFKRAMSQAQELESLDKAERTAIWNDYRSKINQPD